MALPDLLTDLRRDPAFMMNVMAWRTLPAQAARHTAIPTALYPALGAALQGRGIVRLYSHQAEAVEMALAGQDVVVVTPTASGKTLCYNLPVLDTLLRDPQARALYLFPTKALAHDQLHELQEWCAALTLSSPDWCAAYDGDTPTAARPQIRKASRLLLSNPDMLHTGILPYHTNWEPFFANLRYVVLDELHTYRGVFGSHVANVLRRLQRICRFYGSDPQFIAASATIANPQALATRLIGHPVTLIDQSGAPRGEKQIILYNPPLYDAEHGLRRSAVLEAQELALRALHAGLQTIVFGRSRLTTEVLLTYLRERSEMGDWRSEIADPTAEESPISNPQSPIPDLQSPISNPRSPIPNLHSSIRGYRGGYLPNERRAIERGLRDGSVRGVVATNALELGIDIGGLQAAVLCGYPGSIAATWQQMGRAGRTDEGALAILVATGGLLDQYVIQHPDYLFDRSPEHALINPDNLLLLIDHLRCAAFELPFQPGEDFGDCPFTADALQLLLEQGAVQAHSGRYFWSGESYPARQVNLRSTGGEVVTIQVERLDDGRWTTDDGTRTAVHDAVEIDFYGDQRVDEGPVVLQQTVEVIGQIELGSAPRLLHAGAIYLHEGRSFSVRSLDLAEARATVTPTAVDYYTEVTSETEVTVLATQDERAHGGVTVAHGDLLVSSQVVGYRRVKHFTHENLGVFPLEYPPQTLETTGYWFSITPALQEQLAEQGLWFDAVNDYGPNWQAQRRRVRERDGYRCTQCGRPEASGRQHDVHHLTPFRTFGYVAGRNEHYRQANELNNLVLVCRTCHRRLEAGVRVRSGLDGLAYALTNIAPLHLMCDPQDLGVHVLRAEMAGSDDQMTRRQDDDTAIRHSQLPTVYLYERIAAGLGFSARLYELHEALLTAAAELIRACPCEHGCPACVGPVLEGEAVLLETKRLTLALLDLLNRQR
jgi:DEAD/DEAH box helicase domain-containing protein